MREFVIAVLGDAGTGKSLFTKVGHSLFNWPKIEMGKGLKKIEEYAFAVHNVGSIFAGHNWKTIDELCEFYFPTINRDQMMALVNEMVIWYDDNEVHLHNQLRRNALQHLGTTLMRGRFGEDVHINAIRDVIRRSISDRYIVESVRFKNEIEGLGDADHFLPVVVTRPTAVPLAGADAQHVSETDWKEWVTGNHPKCLHLINDGSKVDFIALSAHIFSLQENGNADSFDGLRGATYSCTQYQPQQVG